jgi:hypothetical protein
VLPSERLGISASFLASLTLDEYGAAVLGRLLECAGDAAETEPDGLLVHHADLPGAVDRIVDHVGIDRSLLDADALRRTAEQDAKNPALAYPGTPRGRRADAEPALVAAADRFAADAYVRLEQLRRRAADGGA